MFKIPTIVFCHSVTLQASELVDGVPGNDPLTSTTAMASVTIKDVNDEPPQFNQREYSVSLPENSPLGSTLPHLNMVVSDPDVVCCADQTFVLILNPIFN